MQPRDREIPPGAGADFGLAEGLVGIGGVQWPVPESLAEAVSRHAGKPARMLERFARLPVGTLIWTRSGNGCYRLGRIVGPWRYEDSPAATRVGILHVRPTRWLEREFSAERTPTAVVATFARGGRNLQRIHSTAAERETATLWRDTGLV